MLYAVGTSATSNGPLDSLVQSGVASRGKMLSLDRGGLRIFGA